MNKNILLLIGLLTLLLSLTACNKDEFLKEPSSVGVRFVLNSAGVGGSDRLELNNGYIVLGTIEIEGQRKEGAPFSFSRTFPNGLRFDFNTTNRVEDLVFDLPQGEYEELVVRFTTLDNATSPCLLVAGRYAYQQVAQGSAWVDVAWTSRKEFEQIVTTVQGQPNFTLEEDAKMIAFSIQPKLWFKDISEAKLEQAFCINQSRGRVMLIDQGSNDNLFQAINSELGTTLKANL